MNHNQLKKETNILALLYMQLIYRLFMEQKNIAALYLLNISFIISASTNTDEFSETVDSGDSNCKNEALNEDETAKFCSGLYYYNARWYDPNIGRFTTEDPIRSGLNWYAYCNNNPLRFVDPSGLRPTEDAGSVATPADTPTVNVPSYSDPSSDAAKDVAATKPTGEEYASGAAVPTGDEQIIVDGVVVAGKLATKAAAKAAVSSADDAAKAASKAVASSADDVAKATPDFIVDPSGQTFPVPKGAQGPNTVVNQAGKTTGTSFTGGAGGANGQVSTMRIMDPTPARGSSPGYPNGYIKYENSAVPKPQGVNPYTGQTLPNTQSHFSILVE